MRRGQRAVGPPARSPGRGIRTQRIGVDGAHLALDAEPWQLKGIAYGTCDPAGATRYPTPARAKQDLVTIAESGFNAIRTAGIPPDHILDLAGELDLRLLVSATHADWRTHAQPGRATHRRVLADGRRAVDEALELCGNHSRVVALSVGEPLPVDIARVHDPARIRDVLARLIDDVHRGAPGLLATHRSRGVADLWEVPGQDLVCLETAETDPQRLRRLLFRAQLRAGNLPLLVTDLRIGTEPLGLEHHAELLRGQLAVLDLAGLAGATLAPWTDAWDLPPSATDRVGFGLTTVNRYGKPALTAAQEWAQRRTHALRRTWPRVSVIVTTHNSAASIGGCLDSLMRTTYPDLELLVVDDASTDDSRQIAAAYPVRVLDGDETTSGRNTGVLAASGELVAFLAPESRCHEEWPYRLALSLEDPPVAATGGPLLAETGNTITGRAVAASPGGPSAVVVDDDNAEQLAIGNCAFRSDALRRVGGLQNALSPDSDGVAACWRLLSEGERLGYSPAAQVRAPRPRTVSGYLDEQRRLGQAEMILPASRQHGWDDLGQAVWSGPTYLSHLRVPRWMRPVIGEQPAALSAHRPMRGTGTAALLARLSVALPAVAGLGLAGLLLTPWSPGWLVLPGAALGLAVLVGALAAAGARAPHATTAQRLRFHCLVGLLHVLQPLVRAWGRISVDPSRLGDDLAPAWLAGRRGDVVRLRRALRGRGCRARFGSDPRDADLWVRVGPFVRAGITTAEAPDAARVHVGVRFTLRWWALVVVALLSVVLASLGTGRGALVPALLSALLVVVERGALRRHVAAATRADLDRAPSQPADRPGSAPERIGRHARPRS